MSRPTLDSTPIDTNRTNEKISHLYSTPVDTKIPDPKPLTRPKKSSKTKEKAVKDYIPEDPESDPSSPDS